MLIGISGPSSSGKGTVLYDLESAGFQVIHKQYARDLLREHKLTVDELYQKTFNEIKDFHTQLVDLKDKLEHDFIHTDSLVFVERTFIDFYVYMTTQTGVENKEFYDLCIDKTLEFYNWIIYLKECPQIEEDGVRITSTDQINNQKNLFTSILSESKFSGRVLFVPALSRLDRVNSIITTLKGS